MPEGPEVRKYADALNAVLKDRRIKSLEARTRDARAWLKENEHRLVGQRVLTVTSQGKHLIGLIESDFYFHSHLMMWGRWQTFRTEDVNTRTRRGSKRTQSTEAEPFPIAKDRRERARIVTEGGAAILFSAPIFNVGQGDPYEQIENLNSLGPDVLPIKGKFNTREFRRRLLLPEHLDVTIGAALLNQRILAGLGNYLRAEVLFDCRLDPWRKVGDLKETELRCLGRTAPGLALRAYVTSATASEADRERMRKDPSLVYRPGGDFGTRHLVFRRTNLPCLRCGEPVKQLRQATFVFEQPKAGEGVEDLGEEPERTRIVYFCAKCQKVNSPSFG